MRDMSAEDGFIGSDDAFIGDDGLYDPVGDVTPTAVQVALNDVFRVDASNITSPDPLGDVLSYEWEVTYAPPKSARRLQVNDDGTAYITLDDVGPYFISVRVDSANGGTSGVYRSVVMSQPAAAPYEAQQAYTTSWLWDYLPDVWGRLPLSDRLKVEVFWRGLQQLVASDVMSVLNAKDALSIGTIQDRTFRKWVQIPLTHAVDRADIYIEPERAYKITQLADDRVQIEQSLAQADAYVGAASLVSARTFVLDEHNLQPFDVGADVYLTWSTGSARARVGALVQVGDRVGASLAPPLSTDLPSYPVSVRAEILRGGRAALGSARVGNVTVELGYTQRPDVYSLRGPVPDAEDVLRGPQVRIAGAFAAGVRAGDLLEYAVVDVTGAEVLFVADVLGVVGDYICVRARGTLDENLSRLPGYVPAWSEEVQTAAWQRRYLYTWLSGGDFLELGFGTSAHGQFRLAPRSVVRRSAIPLTNDWVSFFRLTERTERAAIENGLLITEGLQEVNLSRDPIELYENLDFSIRSAEDDGAGLMTDGSAVVVASRYDFARAGVAVGDTFTISSGAGVGSYTVRDVLSTRSVRLDRDVPPSAGARFQTRGQSKTRMLLINTALPDDVRTLWAEVAVESNAAALDAQLGALVGLRLDDWVSRGATNTYRDAVIGLMYARMSASSLEQIENAVSLVAGVPFAPYRSRLQRVDDGYLGEERVTRVILEELLPDGTSTQRYTAHTFPGATDTTNPDFVGLGFNEREGRSYRVGDIIEQFTALALGVKVYDLYETPSVYALDDVLHRHRFRIIIDVDATRANVGALSFIHDFIVEIKPAYVGFLLMLTKFVADTITVSDSMYAKVRAGFYDNPYHHRGPANIVDDADPGRDRVDMSVVSALTTWYPRDGVVEFTESGCVLTSARGGFISPAEIFGGAVDWPQPWLGVGDILVLRGTGLRLVVDAVVSDTAIAASGVVPVELIGTTQNNVSFYVGRMRTDVIHGAVAVALDRDQTLPLAVIGSSATDVSVGDIITVDSPSVTSAPMRVVGLERRLDGVHIRTYPHRPFVGVASATVRAFREQIVDRVLFDDVVHLSRTVNGRGCMYRGVGVSLRALGIEPGDIAVGADNIERVVSCVLHNEIAVTPPFAHTQGQIALKITRGGTNVGADDSDEHERAVGSSAEIVLRGVRARLCGRALYADVQLRAGDIVYFPDEDFDHGEGRGIARVMAVLGGCVYVTAQARVQWTSVTIIRQAPLRWMYFTPPEERALYGDWATQHWR